jgi:hypothetical protein
MRSTAVARGLDFALAAATIGFTDRFDTLFPVGSLLGIWAVCVGPRNLELLGQTLAVLPE